MFTCVEREGGINWVRGKGVEGTLGRGRLGSREIVGGAKGGGGRMGAG